MGKYTKTVTFETDFDGDHIVFELERLDTKTSIGLSTLGTRDDKGVVAFTYNDSLKMVEQFGEILPKQIKTMTGLKDNNGNALTVEETIGKLYFTPLFQDVFVHLMSVSSMSGEEVKN